MNKKHLFIFNLETNLDNPILASTHDWIASFANEVECVHVYSTHVGKFDLPKIVDIHELGGGTTFKKVRAILRLCKAAFLIYKFRKDSIVFHHMSARTAVFPGILIRIWGVPQGLWYSHSANPLSLRLATRIVSVIVTSTEGAVPIKSPKVSYVGHGLDMSKAVQVFNQDSKSRDGIVSLGRVARVKNLDKLLFALSNNLDQFSVTFIGPSEDGGVVETELREIAFENGITLEILPPVEHPKVLKKLAEFSIYYSGTPKSVDKATIEAASVGCYIATTEGAAKDLTGMNLVWEELKEPNHLSIGEQVRILDNLSPSQEAKMRRLLHEQAMKKNEVSSTTRLILSKILSSKP
jgi:glycosyltransferase involved in cell wall biosynthesis